MTLDLHPLGALAVLSVLSGLSAQDPRSLPTPVAAADDSTTTLAQASAAQHGLGRPATRVHFDRPTADGPLWAIGTAWKASFDATGATVIPFFGSDAPQNFPLRIELANASVGGEPLALPPGSAELRGTTVQTDRGSLTEVFDTALDSLEQSWVFDTLPNRGAITVDVQFTGDYEVAAIPGGLRFHNQHGHVDYTKAVAVDADGDRLPLDILWQDGRARIEIPQSFVAEATLPLVLDPVLNYWYALASGTGLYQHDSDVASFQALGGRTLLVWQRQWSATDQDVWGLMFDGNLGLVATDFSIDFTSEDWLKVAVASNNHAQNFLLVGEVRVGLLWFIAGRTVAANAALGPVFPIEREGVVGLVGNNHHPDVGGDPYFGPGRYTVVFQKRTLTTSLIYMKQVTPTGGLVTTNPIGLETDTSTEKSRPAISKSCGQASGTQNFLVTWQRKWPSPPYDGDVWGRMVGWNGALNTNAFPVAITVGDETAPSPGSPIDVAGVRHWPLTNEIASAAGQPRDVACRLIRGDGSVAGQTLVNTPVPGQDDFDPEVDSDGTRFVVTRSVGNGVEAVTLAFLPGNTFRVEERTGLITSSLDTNEQPNIHADYSGGNGVTPRYTLCFSERSTNTFRLAAFHGTQGGSSGFATRFTQCGATTISGNGQSILGQQVNLSASGPGFTGILLGFPGSSLIGPCGCLLGVSQGVTMPNPLYWPVPNNPLFVGLPLSAQAFSLSGSACYNTVDVSHTLDFTVR